MRAEHDKKAKNMLLWLDRNLPAMQDCRRAGSKDPGKCFSSLAPVRIYEIWDPQLTASGCTFHGRSQRLDKKFIDPDCKNLNLTMFAPGFFPNATQLVCIPVMALVHGPTTMGDPGMSMTAWPPRIDLSRHLKKHTLQMVLSTWAKTMTKIEYLMQMKFMECHQYWKHQNDAKLLNGKWKVTLEEDFFLAWQLLDTEGLLRLAS